MIEIELDGRKVEVAEGSMVMHAAEKAGTYIPHFCYHKKLSIAANCRMCLVDVEKAPKPMPACATPVTNGMIVRTQSDKAIKAQKSVMEFLLINHPLDCPICDQGGECQLQDLAVGYGGSSSRYDEEKRVVLSKDVGPLVSMAEMSRCIHCTRCVRFGQEVAGAMELGMIHRGEHSEITTVMGDTIDSELSGNMIDLCPVGALTSKPFRYQARTWELSRRKSVSPHDSTGANLIVQVKNNQVLRVLPLDNEAVNECWIADRDRFSYEALNTEERLTQPMIKQGGQWRGVDWQTALEYVANGIKQIKAEHGAASIGTLVSPHSTLEELHLAGKLTRGLGSENIDHRLRHAAFPPDPSSIRWLGTSIAALSTVRSALVVGSNLRKDHPLFALRLRAAVRNQGAAVHSLNHVADDWAMSLAGRTTLAPGDWVIGLARLAAGVARRKQVVLPEAIGALVRSIDAELDAGADRMAASFGSDGTSVVLLGNAAVHHPHAPALMAIARWIGEQTGASVGCLGEAANTVGAQLVRAQPGPGGKNATEMLGGVLRAVLLLGTEPAFDAAAGAKSAEAFASASLVVSLNPFQANLEVADVLLPIAPFTETPGTFINAEGRVQSFRAVVKPLGDARPAWKVLRVLGNMFGLPGFDQEASEDVLAEALRLVGQAAKSGDVLAFEPSREPMPARFDLSPVEADPCVASIYQLDGIVRRAPALQATADGRAGRGMASFGAVNRDEVAV